MYVKIKKEFVYNHQVYSKQFASTKESEKYARGENEFVRFRNWSVANILRKRVVKNKM